MTDLEVIEQALKSLVKRFKNTEDEVPISFETVIQWLLEEIDEVKRYSLEQTVELAIVQLEMALTKARIKAEIDDDHR